MSVQNVFEFIFSTLSALFKKISQPIFNHIQVIKKPSDYKSPDHRYNGEQEG